MTSVSRKQYFDPDELSDQFLSAATELTATGKGPYTAELCRITFENLALLHVSTSFATLVDASNIGDRAILHLHASPGVARVIGATEITTDAILFSRPGERFLERKFRSTSDYISLSLTSEEMEDLSITMNDTALRGKTVQPVFTPPPAPLATMRRLHATAMDLVNSAPELLRNRQVAHGLEQELKRAMALCLASLDDRPQPASVRRHTDIMKRFYDVTRERITGPLYVPELCRMLGVSASTLRQCCHHAMGMSPTQYLWLRRMHKARGALLAAEPDTASVTEVAMANGFWELGRFAVQYRTLFGERPLATLQRKA